MSLNDRAKAAVDFTRIHQRADKVERLLTGASGPSPWSQETPTHFAVRVASLYQEHSRYPSLDLAKVDQDSFPVIFDQILTDAEQHGQKRLNESPTIVQRTTYDEAGRPVHTFHGSHTFIRDMSRHRHFKTKLPGLQG